MESETFRAEVRPIATVHRIVWVAFVGAVPLYMIVAYVQIDRAAPGGGAPLLSNPLTIPLVVISVLAAALAPYMPRILSPDRRIRQMVDRQLDPQATARLSADEQRLLGLLPNFYVGFIVRLAFNESIALYGLVLAFFSKSFVAVLPFAIVSIALNLMVPLPLDSMRQRIAGLGPQAGGMPTRPR